MRTHRWPPLALLLVFGLGSTGCSAAYGAQYRSASYGHTTARQAHHSHSGYANTRGYNNIRRDADRYAEFLDRELRLSSRQERDIERLLIDRAADLLRNTRPAYHSRVYPFPRDGRSSSARGWWDRTDRYIERMMSPRQRQEYRLIVRYLEHGQRGRNPWERGRDYYYDYDGDSGRGRGR